MRILVAEDDTEFRDVLSETLKLHGHTVTDARDGDEAFLLLKERAFDLIIADIQMPKRTGAQLHEMVRGDGQLKYIPFIYVTGFAILRIATPLDKGLDFMVNKVQFERLLQVIGEIETCCNLREKDDAVLGAA